MKTAFHCLLFFALLPLSSFCQILDASKLSKVEKTVSEFADKGFKGTVLVAQGDQVVKVLHTGHVDKKGEVPITDKTLFNLASISKGLTSIAILQLVQKGLLDLQDPINKYLPNVLASASGITIHHLLVHQSGLPNNYAADGETDLQAAVKKIFASPLESTPGEKFLYSGTNYNLLAMIIEKVTQSSWEEYAQKNILRPLKMNATIFWYEYPASSHPKVLPNFKVKEKMARRNYGYVGATGVFSTAQDLLALNKTFSDTILLNRQSLDLMSKGFISLGKEEPFTQNKYSYGLFVKQLGDKSVLALRGNEEGWGNAISYYFKEDQVSIIVLSNVDELKNGERPHIAISREIIKELLD